jgi:hypothetical protein
MEELLNQIVTKTGLPADQAKSALAAVLGFVRGKLPEASAGQLDSALGGLGLQGPLPAGLKSEEAVAEHTGLSKGQVGSLVQTVLAFLKAKLPAGLVDQLEGMLSQGGLGGVVKKVTGLFGKS